MDKKQKLGDEVTYTCNSGYEQLYYIIEFWDEAMLNSFGSQWLNRAIIGLSWPFEVWEFKAWFSVYTYDYDKTCPILSLA